MQRWANVCALCSWTCSFVFYFFPGFTAAQRNMLWSTSSPDICLSQLLLNSSLAWISHPLFVFFPSPSVLLGGARCLPVRTTAPRRSRGRSVLNPPQTVYWAGVTAWTLCGHRLFYQLRIVNRVWLLEAWPSSPLAWGFGFLCWQALREAAALSLPRLHTARVCPESPAASYILCITITSGVATGPGPTGSWLHVVLDVYPPRRRRK